MIWCTTMQLFGSARVISICNLLGLNRSDRKCCLQIRWGGYMQNLFSPPIKGKKKGLTHDHFLKNNWKGMTLAHACTYLTTLRQHKIRLKYSNGLTLSFDSPIKLSSQHGCATSRATILLKSAEWKTQRLNA